MKSAVGSTIDLLFDTNGSAGVSVLIIILVLGTILFWIGNKLMAGLEKLHKPKSLDHLRQSIFYYLTSLYLSVLFLEHGYHGEALALIPLEISVWAIFINAIFLYKRRRSNIS